MSAPPDDLRVGDLSEGEILRGILDRLAPSAALVGPGDDAALLAAPDGRVVATTDTLVHGPDFRLAWPPAGARGRRRRIAAGRRPPATSPTSPRWALDRRLCSSPSRCRTTPASPSC